MSVYIIGASDERGPVKIGFSAAPCRRLRKLRSAERDPSLRLLAIIPGDRANEGQLHRALHDLALGGERFRRDGRIARLIADYSVDPDLAERHGATPYRYKPRLVFRVLAWGTPDPFGPVRRRASRVAPEAWDPHREAVVDVPVSFARALSSAAMIAA